MAEVINHQKMIYFGVVMSISTPLRVYSYPQEACTTPQGQRDAQLMKAQPVELYNWHHHSCVDFTGLTKKYTDQIYSTLAIEILHGHA